MTRCLASISQRVLIGRLTEIGSFGRIDDMPGFTFTTSVATSTVAAPSPSERVNAREPGGPFCPAHFRMNGGFPGNCKKPEGEVVNERTSRKEQSKRGSGRGSVRWSTRIMLENTSTFDADAFLSNWDEKDFVPSRTNGSSFRQCLIKAFNLPEDDGYVYRAQGVTTLDLTQKAINGKRAHGLHTWYHDKSGAPVGA
jgi:hypothetical protein